MKVVRPKLINVVLGRTRMPNNATKATKQQKVEPSGRCDAVFSSISIVSVFVLAVERLLFHQIDCHLRRSLGIT